MRFLSWDATRSFASKCSLIMSTTCLFECLLLPYTYPIKFRIINKLSKHPYVSMSVCCITTICIYPPVTGVSIRTTGYFHRTGDVYLDTYIFRYITFCLYAETLWTDDPGWVWASYDAMCVPRTCQARDRRGLHRMENAV